MQTLHGAAWYDGQILAFSGLDGTVPYATNLVATTRMDSDAGLDVRLPGAARITFGGEQPGQVRIATDAFSAVAGGRELCGLLPDAHHLLIFGDCRVLDCADTLRTESRDGVLLIGVRAHFDANWLTARTASSVRVLLDARDAQCTPPPGLDAREEAAYRRAVSILRGQVYTPQGRIQHRWTTPDRWPHRDMWLWDSAFHAIGWRHLDPAVARDALSAVFDCQHADGFIAHQMNPARDSQVTQPPVLAYAVKLVHEAEPNPEWVAALYPGLARYLAWDTAHRDTDGDGLLEWDIEADPQCRSGESGMDNSPRFDSAQKLDATDFNAFLAQEYVCMAELAPLAGHAADAAAWRQAAADLRQRINARLWDSRQAFYFDYDPTRNGRTDIWACSGFLPLICDAPDAEMAQRLAAHLAPGGRFDTPLPVASIPPGEPSYVPDMWRGPSWLNMSWLIAEGLARYGMVQQAQILRARWMRVLAREHALHGTLFEYYDAQDRVSPTGLLRKGKSVPVHPHRVIRDYGWTATLFVDWCHRPIIRAGTAEVA